MAPSRITRLFCGITLLSLPTVAFGGYFLLQVATQAGLEASLSELQRSFFRAGHAHAGVLTLLGLVAQLLCDHTCLHQHWVWVARVAFPLAGLCIPAGFFLSVLSTPTAPGPLLGLIYAGAGLLALGCAVLGVGLIGAARRG